jgi:hypothetical protein
VVLAVLKWTRRETHGRRGGEERGVSFLRPPINGLFSSEEACPLPPPFLRQFVFTTLIPLFRRVRKVAKSDC